ncbi:MAG: polysaccharide deacetylase family protein [Thermodesulfovibrionales bacterium]|nr:polysaccharide deacetylase family protein [Thermodesulfovibrionales bacterium]
MLLILMYHRIVPDTFTFFVEQLLENYPIVLPGDHLPKGKLSICLTFDDAYYDFYYYVYPFLKQKKIKALLGIPVNFIINKTNLEPKTRLNVSINDIMKTNVHKEKVPFCTWEEIKEMINSGYVRVASHTKNHIDLSQDNCDLNEEIIQSKDIIEKITSQKVDTFIFPYGKFSNKSLSFTKKHYKYLMRIGSALNRDWNNKNNILYRINGEKLNNINHLKKSHLFQYYLKYLLNMVRGK